MDGEVAPRARNRRGGLDDAGAVATPGGAGYGRQATTSPAALVQVPVWVTLPSATVVEPW